MRNSLILLFVLVLMTMLIFTIRASLHTHIFDVSPLVLSDPWFQATLVDAYLGFITFYVWVAYRESSWLARGIWFLAIMSLGNMAMAAYVLWQLVRLPPEAGLESILVRPQSNTQS